MLLVTRARCVSVVSVALVRKLYRAAVRVRHALVLLENLIDPVGL